MIERLFSSTGSGDDEDDDDEGSTQRDIVEEMCVTRSFI